MNVKNYINNSVHYAKRVNMKSELGHKQKILTH